MSKTRLLAFLCFFAAACTAQEKPASSGNTQITYSAEALQADIRLLKKALQEAHPGLYNYNSRQEIEQRFDSVCNSIQTPQTELEFFSAVSRLVASIGCGHTTCMPSKEYKKQYEEKTCRYFPFKIKILEKRAYMVRNLSTDSTLICGSEILSINGQSLGSILDVILPHIASDGYNLTLKYHDMEDNFMYYYSEFIAQPLWFSLQIKSPGDDLIKNISLPALHLEEMQRISAKRKGYKDLHLPKEKPLQFELTTDNTAILTIHSFDGRDIGSAHEHYRSFLKHAFDSVKYHGVNDLIIDLRNNGGGDDDNGWYLYSFLTDSAFQYYDRVEVASAKRFSFLRHTNRPPCLNLFHLFVKKDSAGRYLWAHGPYTRIHRPNERNYNGSVFILINGESFSATTEFAAVADFHKRAVFVGEETGGAYQGNNSGLEIMLTLPNSGVRVRIPLMKYICAVGNNHKSGRGIMPDYTVLPSIDDILKGVDTEKEFTLDLIRKKHCKSCGK
ncbi:MAG TPA: S41 family peptidase [Bacteroidia bacterium]|jgi:hypothetical protein|nr:S41 family peptidase [Bacteroidia bacterium]